MDQSAGAKYQKRRRELLRRAGLMQKNVWIRMEDDEAFEEATARLTNHALLVSFLCGFAGKRSREDIVKLISSSADYGYDPSKVLWLFNMTFLPNPSDEQRRQADALIRTFGLHLTLAQIRGEEDAAP